MSAFTNLTLDPNATLSYFLSHKLVRDLTQRLLLWNQTQNSSLFLDNQTLSDLYQATKEGNAYGRGSISVVITITVIYLIIFLTGIVGNISTCVVISKNKSMHTVTNYYLFSLAVSDLLLLISGVPLEVHKLWYPYRFGFGEHVCIIQGLFAETSANATVLTITAFTIERYVAICHPFLSHAASSKLSRAIRYIAVIWLLALGLAIPQAMQFGVVLEYNGMTQCTFKREVVEYAFEVSGFVFFVGPMTVITVLYACIGVKLRRSRLVRSDNGGNASTNSGKNSLNKFRVNGSQTKVIRMLVAVTVAFFFCWAPFHAQRMMAVYGRTNEVYHETYIAVYHALNHVSGVLYYASTCVNPLLYNIMSNKFREAFKSTLAQHCGLKPSDSVGHKARYSALSRFGASMRQGSSVAEMQASVRTNHRWRQSFKQDDSGGAVDDDVDITMKNSGYGGRHVIALTRHPQFYRIHQLSEPSSQSTVLSTISSKTAEGNNNNNLFRKSASGDSNHQSRKLQSFAERLRNGVRSGKSGKKEDQTPRQISHSESISNSSLQDLDEEEYSGSELARYMAQINVSIR